MLDERDLQAIAQLIDLKFEPVYKRLDVIESRLDNMESRLSKVESRLDNIEADISELKTDVKSIKTNVMFNRRTESDILNYIDERIDRRINVELRLLKQELKSA